MKSPQEFERGEKEVSVLLRKKLGFEGLANGYL
jgi:hypothetical protein